MTNKLKYPAIGQRYKRKTFQFEAEGLFVVHELENNLSGEDEDISVVGFFVNFKENAPLLNARFNLINFWDNFEEVLQVKIAPQNKFAAGEKVIFISWSQEDKAYHISPEIIESVAIYKDKIGYFLTEQCDELTGEELFTELEAMERLKQIVYENKGEITIEDIL